MSRRVILLRGINVGAANRLPMADLKVALTEAGYPDTRTYMQSGNVLVRTDASPAGLASEVKALIAERFGLDVPVVVRTRDELQAVVDANPFPVAALIDPKHFQVTFLSGEPAPDRIRELAKHATDQEQFTSIGRELYAWHPDGIHNSRLAGMLTDRKLGVTATARNWTTVTTLLELAADDA